jgi:hypothetical protein
VSVEHAQDATQNSGLRRSIVILFDYEPTLSCMLASTDAGRVLLSVAWIHTQEVRHAGTIRHMGSLSFEENGAGCRMCQ